MSPSSQRAARRKGAEWCRRWASDSSAESLFDSSLSIKFDSESVVQRLLDPDAPSLLAKAMASKRRCPVWSLVHREAIFWLFFFLNCFEFCLLVCLRQDWCGPSWSSILWGYGLELLLPHLPRPEFLENKIAEREKKSSVNMLVMFKRHQFHLLALLSGSWVPNLLCEINISVQRVEAGDKGPNVSRISVEVRADIHSGCRWVPPRVIAGLAIS